MARASWGLVGLEGLPPSGNGTWGCRRGTLISIHDLDPRRTLLISTLAGNVDAEDGSRRKYASSPALLKIRSDAVRLELLFRWEPLFRLELF